jgi:hypothetical protein
VLGVSLPESEHPTARFPQLADSLIDEVLPAA